MTENAHTPGEWKFRQATEKFYACLMVGGRMLAIFRKPVSDADGRLIAAAPDLLEALEGLRMQALQSPDLLQTDYGQEALTAANAAIAKATGAPSHD